MNHAPVQDCFGNWVWWLATCRGKRLGTSFLNAQAKVVRTVRRIVLRLPRAYRHADAFIAALARPAPATAHQVRQITASTG
jgi:hypothetical protein